MIQAPALGKDHTIARVHSRLVSRDLFLFLITKSHLKILFHVFLLDRNQLGHVAAEGYFSLELEGKAKWTEV